MNLPFLVHHLFEMQYRNEKHIAFTYPTHRPRPDIAFPVSVVGQFMKTPRLEFFTGKLLYVRYLKKAPGQGLLYKPHGHLRIESLSDADWAGSPLDRSSTIGYCTFLFWEVEKSKAKCRCSF